MEGVVQDENERGMMSVVSSMERFKQILHEQKPFPNESTPQMES